MVGLSGEGLDNLAKALGHEHLIAEATSWAEDNTDRDEALALGILLAEFPDMTISEAVPSLRHRVQIPDERKSTDGKYDIFLRMQNDVSHTFLKGDWKSSVSRFPNIENYVDLTITTK